MKKFIAIFCLPAFLLLITFGSAYADESNSLSGGRDPLYFPEKSELKESPAKKLEKSENSFELRVDLGNDVDDPKNLPLENGIDWFLTDNFFINLNTKLPLTKADADMGLAGKAEVDNEYISLEEQVSRYIDLDSWAIGAGIKFYF